MQVGSSYHRQGHLYVSLDSSGRCQFLQPDWVTVIAHLIALVSFPLIEVCIVNLHYYFNLYVCPFSYTCMLRHSHFIDLQYLSIKPFFVIYEINGALQNGI